GPANAGKVALLLDRYLETLDREPVLIVPNRPDVDRIERDLLTRSPVLLGGWIGTFDDLFQRLVDGDPDWRPIATDAQRLVLVRRAIAATNLDRLDRSARSGGFADSLLSALGELQSALVDPGSVDGDLGLLYGAYREQLDAHGLWDRDLLRAR